ncbi:pre-mRNA polyadenylation factor Fip1 [Hamiltosporidium tvaerminnensis]|uniref:Pre-mRNA polyadenylation factor Fip1 n=2 Tax=Hamiltosporidium TaxID=1176354 RepID=A0A4Q9M046_9MICR|nr:cleavage polyadenylation factor subunit fip1 [Hamiltosporidium tvaerminnensis]TBU05412.1 pre-mRNA polyadenylation factor Fip1 [Hamiltosporidium tvaerminnensis]TBU09534.1 pre-mRNA polyadenylation factor Fip1 [Hamiltosporidium magnivora]TBU19925.1 pre-mRNA polyadenylation factor Fip1 [Hamiltosporidium tvaerminnensis]
MSDIDNNDLAFEYKCEDVETSSELEIIAEEQEKKDELKVALESQNYTGQGVFEFELDTLEEKPWKKPGEDITDYFNYGFDETTWRMYCEKQKGLRTEYTPSRTFETKSVDRKYNQNSYYDREERDYREDSKYFSKEYSQRYNDRYNNDSRYDDDRTPNRYRRPGTYDRDEQRRRRGGGENDRGQYRRYSRK